MAKWKIPVGEPKKNYKLIMDSVFDNGAVTTKTGKLLVIKDGTKKAVITGSKLTYDAEGNLTGGTVKTMKVYDGKTKVVEVTEINQNGAKFQKALDNYDSLVIVPLLSTVPNQCTGSPQDDLFVGGAKNDKIALGAGNDFAYGKSGADVIDCGSGQNYAEGGGGNDKFALANNGFVFVADFQVGKDAFLLSVDDYTGLGKAGGPIGANKVEFDVADPTALPNSVKIYVDANGIIHFNNPNDGPPDFQIGQVSPGAAGLMDTGSFLLVP